MDLHEKVREEIERTESSTQKFIQKVIEEHFNGKRDEYGNKDIGGTGIRGTF